MDVACVRGGLYDERWHEMDKWRSKEEIGKQEGSCVARRKLRSKEKLPIGGVDGGSRAKGGEWSLIWSEEGRCINRENGA